ncbi:DNA-deoxyinosine glycosylase [Paenibacillus gansuensis]|uniref:DNA-deoxyinosine glycosylase n=1 Tax=Paenibacillus gansuensis TaxID=306542 RepID=A0ABW5PJ25_9BACL
MTQVTAFPPVWDSRSKVLILGTMPGVQSLENQQYYANPRNQFWQILYALFGRTPDAGYEERLRFALDHGIALWDVLHGCEREGSLDADIREPEANDLPAFLQQPDHGIRHVFFNGSKADQLFRKLVFLPARPVSEEPYRMYCLPSTSPAHTVPFDAKMEKWQLIKEVLDNSR